MWFEYFNLHHQSVQVSIVKDLMIWCQSRVKHQHHLAWFQLAAFSGELYTFQSYLAAATMSFRYNFLLDWDPGYEVPPYPPGMRKC